MMGAPSCTTWLICVWGLISLTSSPYLQHRSVEGFVVDNSAEFYVMVKLAVQGKLMADLLRMKNNSAMMTI